MNHTTLLEEAFALALRLEPKERLQLIERIASSVEGALAVQQPPEEPSETEHWGKSLNRLLDEMGPIDLVDPEVEDPVEWVKLQREKRRQHRSGEWKE